MNSGGEKVTVEIATLASGVLITVGLIIGGRAIHAGAKKSYLKHLRNRSN
jgi:hypothetical protein